MKLKQILNEAANKRIRYTVFNYGDGDQDLFSGRATSPEQAAEQAAAELERAWGFPKEKLNYKIKDDDYTDGKIIVFPDAKLSIDFHTKKPGSNQYETKYKINETKSLGKKVTIVKGEHKGKSGVIREIKHGMYKGADKSYYIDLDDGKQANNLPGSAFRLVKKINERSDEDYKAAVQKAADALVYAYDEVFHQDGDQGMNDIARLKHLKDIADAARNIAATELGIG